MLVRIDPTSDVPIFDQVAGSIRADMVAGGIRPGDKLAPARELAAALRVNLHTVLRAYQLLRDEGLVDMRRGRGAVATPAAGGLSQLHSEIVALSQKALALGMSPDSLAALVRDAVRGESG
ncbi:MAG: GntR family transcriptional regulator [Demequina sp.]|uniref:GntR family transcriptional regulator n=1 Tax=Demequina sp. TaxID=2050685 RepID=UPI0019A61F18|nr:GntR family transcriptional regulator [Demequina sp.]MBC7298980.1 GntR family transcriptional regulator [Demequina sp.]